MKIMWLFLTFIFSFLASQTIHAEAYSCHGKVPNPISDIAWKSIFPIKIGGVTVADYGGEDTGEDPPAICACPIPVPPFIRIGLGITFWEPARVSEVTTTAMCSPLLGGDVLSSSTGDKVKRGSARTATEDRNSFYYVHFYMFPLTNWMTWLTGSVCENGESFDVLMLTEYEPTWQDDELSLIFAPEAALFANVIGQAACAVDCVAATTHFPLKELIWCAGCQGSIYPMSGNVINHESGIQASLLVTQRIHNKMHRTGISLDMNSVGSMCLAQIQPIMNKQSYKTQMLYPIPYTLGAQPYGRSEAVWSSFREFPVQGEDFAHLIWRRRVCCAF